MAARTANGEYSSQPTNYSGEKGKITELKEEINSIFQRVKNDLGPVEVYFKGRKVFSYVTVPSKDQLPGDETKLRKIYNQLVNDLHVEKDAKAFHYKLEGDSFSSALIDPASFRLF
jgi:hypothetical protein